MTTKSQAHTRNDKTSKRSPAKSGHQSSKVPRLNPAAALQRIALTSPAGPTPADILTLQRTVGNRATQQLLARTGSGQSTAAASLPRSSQPQVTSPGGASIVVQRRVPRLEEIDRINVTNPSTLKKLKKAIARTIKDQSEQARAEIEAETQNQLDSDLTTLLSDDGTLPQLKGLIQIIKEVVDVEHELLVSFTKVFTRDDDPDKLKKIEWAEREAQHPAVEHPGAPSTFVPWKKALTDRATQRKFKELVEKAQAALRRSGADDDALRRVFGEEGYAQAKPVFAMAANALGRLLRNNKVGADLSGEGKEMCFGGLTSTMSMLLDGNIFNDIANDNTDNEQRHLVKICHESFHAAVGAIQDAGGYRHERSFPLRTTQEKLVSAPHYEEVVWQVEGWSEPRTLRPPDSTENKDETNTGGVKDTRDIVGKAHAGVTDYFKEAWVQALRNHGDLKEGQTYQKKQQASIFPDSNLSKESRKKLTYYSTLEGWTLHKRLRERKKGRLYPLISDLDLVLSEGVTKRLAQAYGQEMGRLPQTVTDWEQAFDQTPAEEDTAAIKDKLIERALENAGPIRHSLIRDKEMVKILEDIFKGNVNPTTEPLDALPK